MPNSIFVALGTILATLGVLVAVAVPFVVSSRESTSRDLQVSVLSDVSASDTLALFGDDIEIRYLGQQAEDLRLTDVLVRNSGEQAIIKDDFDGRLKLFFDDGEMLNAVITNLVPNNIRTSVSNTPQEASMTETLLNSGDSLTVRLLSTAPADQTVQVDVRIRGIGPVTVSLVPTGDGDQSTSTGLILIGMVAGGLAVSFVIAYFSYIGSRAMQLTIRRVRELAQPKNDS